MSYTSSPTETKRESDTERESRLHRFFDDVYGKAGFSIERVDDAERQLKGIDVILEKDGETLFVDEKSAVSRPDGYWNLNRFSLEIGSIGRGSRIGWAVNDDLMTTHYCFNFMNTIDWFNTIDACEMILVPKTEAKRIIERYGFTDVFKAVKFMSDFPRRVKRGKTRYGGEYEYINLDGGIILYDSIHLAEHPITLSVPKTTWRSLSVMDADWFDDELKITDGNGTEIYRERMRLRLSDCA